MGGENRRGWVTPEAQTFFEQLGVRVRFVREAAGISQQDLATQVGVTRVTITQYESGQQHMGFISLYRIGRALDLDVWTLLPSEWDMGEVPTRYAPPLLGRNGGEK
jgi:transcriptional regulator with XRE-family HTH domain